MFGGSISDSASKPPSHGPGAVCCRNRRVVEAHHIGVRSCCLSRRRPGSVARRIYSNSRSSPFHHEASFYDRFIISDVRAVTIQAPFNNSTIVSISFDPIKLRFKLFLFIFKLSPFFRCLPSSHSRNPSRPRIRTLHVLAYEPFTSSRTNPSRPRVRTLHVLA